LPALILVEHPALYRMVVPYCPLHYVIEAPWLDPVDVDSPEGQALLRSHTLLRGYVVPRQRS